MASHHGAFFREQLRRELSGRYRGSSPLWVLFQPLMLLAVYSFVFTQIFRARVPANMADSFVLYLAVAYWPWSAFNESLLRSLSVIQEHAALIRKVPIRRELLVAARIAAIYILHLLGYLAVLLALSLLGHSINWLWLPIGIMLIALMMLMALGFGLLFSAIQVIVPSLQHVVQPTVLLVFFSTPILWSPTMLPERYQALLHYSPLAWWVQTLRAVVLNGQWPGWFGLTLFTASALFVLWLGHWVFQRLAPHFEDYL